MGVHQVDAWRLPCLIWPGNGQKSDKWKVLSRCKGCTWASATAHSQAALASRSGRHLGAGGHLAGPGGGGSTRGWAAAPQTRPRHSGRRPTPSAPPPPPPPPPPPRDVAPGSAPARGPPPRHVGRRPARPVAPAGPGAEAEGSYTPGTLWSSDRGVNQGHTRSRGAAWRPAAASQLGFPFPRRPPRSPRPSSCRPHSASPPTPPPHSRAARRAPATTLSATPPAPAPPPPPPASAAASRSLVRLAGSGPGPRRGRPRAGAGAGQPSARAGPASARRPSDRGRAPGLPW